MGTITNTLMITPINMIPSVDPILDVSSIAGVGVVCTEMEAAPGFCAAATV